MKNKTSETHRLDEMIDVVMKVARGNYSVQVKLSGKNDVLDSLAMGFNMMIDDIKTSYEDLDKQRSELSTNNNHLQQEITKRKQAEEKLQHYATELEQSNKEIKQFAYIVSHDLRAPLVNLKGFSGELHSSLEELGSAIKEALPHLDEKKQQVVNTALQQDVPEALDFIESSVTRMDNFINAILKLSRFGHRQLTFETVEMDTLVQTVLKSLAHQIEEYKIKVTVSALPEIVADRISMEQTMSNLLDNAVLYLDPNRPGKIEVSAVYANNETIFKISDNGRGIRKTDMNKVFAPFRRAGQEDVIGEGMGLAYVKTLVHRHEGRIWCESEYGVGTTFTFTISNLLKKGGSSCPRHMK